MQTPYRVVEMNVSDEWLPIGVALPHENTVVAHMSGLAGRRTLNARTVEELNETHLWGKHLRWSELAHCTPAVALNPRRLLAEVAAHGRPEKSPSVIDNEATRRIALDELAQFGEVVIQTPQDALRELKRGNDRFYSSQSKALNFSASQRRAQAQKQSPFAIIVGCSDSRAPTEFIFDQGPGNLFITRVAGNVIGPNVLASVEYAIRHLQSLLVVVMGHEGCGAVSAAMLPQALRNQESENVRNLLELIAPAVSDLPPIRDAKARMREAVVGNVRLQVNTLRANKVVSEYLAAGKIAVVGGYYSISSGAVDFYESEEDLALSPALTATAGAHA